MERYCWIGKSINVGINNPMAKLSANEVRLIKTLKGTVTQRQRAKMFNVSPSTIRSIDDGRTWENVHE